MQNGSVIQTKRRSGQSVWEFRWRDRTSGKAVYRRIVVGTMEQYKTEADAREIVEGIVLEINSDDLRLRPTVLTVSQLIEHYRRRELSVDNTWKSYATKMGYENYLKRWIAPKWGMYPVARIKPIEVELWLRQLPLACGSCAKIRNIMSVLFNHACRYELYSENPIHLVRQSAKRRRVPHIVHVDEIKRLLDNVEFLPRLLIFLDATTGLRQSELFGLRWSDLDFDNAEISVVRSVVHGVSAGARLNPLPSRAKGKRPIWGQSMMRKQIHPKLEKLGINKRIGWHTFRHSFSTCSDILAPISRCSRISCGIHRHGSPSIPTHKLSHQQSETLKTRWWNSSLSAD